MLVMEDNALLLQARVFSVDLGIVPYKVQFGCPLLSFVDFSTSTCLCKPSFPQVMLLLSVPLIGLLMPPMKP